VRPAFACRWDGSAENLIVYKNSACQENRPLDILCFKSAIADLEFNVDFVSLGDFLQLLSDTANIDTEYDTTGIQLGLGLTPQGANEIIGIFLKENGYSLDIDVLSELSLTDKKILYTKEAHDICDAVLQKLTK